MTGLRHSTVTMKKYEATSPLFSTIPPEVSKVLLHDFENLLDSDLCTITKYDRFDLPGGIDLLEDSNTPPSLQNIVNEDLFTEKVTVLPAQDAASQILPELSLPDKLANIQTSIKQKQHIPPAPDTVMQNIQQNTKSLNSTDISMQGPQQKNVVTNIHNLAELPGSDSEDSDKEESKIRVNSLPN